MTDEHCFCPVTRRAFLRSGALALVSLGLDPLFLGRAAFARGESTTTRGRILVCLFQRGAVDGLSMVIPHGDGQYYSERPRIGVPASEVLDLDGHFGLHPALGGLMPLWRDGSGDRARGRLARYHPQPFRRAGLHGVGDARNQGNPGRLAQPARTARRRAPRHTVSIGGVRPAAAPHSGRERSRARDF